MQRIKELVEIWRRGGVELRGRVWIQSEFPFLGFHLHVEFVDDMKEEGTTP